MRLEDLEGLFVGSLNAEEMEILDQACRDGLAYKAYEGAAGFMGLSKVRLIPTPKEETNAD